MKKFISIALLIAMCLSLFAGCKEDAPETSGALADAKAYLVNMYQTAGKDEVMVLTGDKDVLSVVTIDGVGYNVEWSVSITEGASDAVKVGESDKENHVVLDIPEKPETDILFTATATVKDSEGNTEAATFSYKVNASASAGLTDEEIVELAYQLENGEMMEGNSTLTGVITMVKTAWDESYQNITVIIQIGDLKDKRIECYRLKGDGAKELAIGDTITVTGILKNYNGTIEFDAGCSLDNVVKGETVTAPTDPKEIVDAAYALEAGDSLPYEATLTGVISTINTPYDSGYQNLTVTMDIEGCDGKPIQCYRLKGEGADTLTIGDTITVTGYITNYNGKIQFGQGCTLGEIVKGDGEVPVAPTDPKEIVDAAYALEAGTSLPYSATLTGIVTSVDTPWDDGYQNITVTITVVGCEEQPIKCYRLKGEGADGLIEGDTITVTGYLTNYNDIIEFAAGCTLDAVVKSEGTPEDPTDPTDPTDPEDPKPTDPKPTTKPEDPKPTDPKPTTKPTEPPKATEPADTKPSTSSDPKKIVKEAYALAEGESLDYTATLTGKVTAVNELYNADFGNITVTITVSGCEDMPIKCFRLKGSGINKIAKGDTITVTGTLKNYYGEIEFDAGCTLKKRVSGGGTPAVQETEPKKIVAAAYALADGEALPYKSTLTGKITKINEEYSADFQNITVTIVVNGCEDQPIKCYRLKGDGADKLGLGDTITVTGTIKNYKGTVEFDLGCSLDKVVSAPKAPTDAKDIVDAAYALEPGKTLDYEATLTGKITTIKTAYSTEFENVTVIIEVKGREDKPIECFRMKGDGAADLLVGDTITVSGMLKNYNGTIEFDAGCKLGKVVSGGAKLPTTPKEIVAAAYALEPGKSLPGAVTLTGKITEINTPYDAGYKNITVTIVVEGCEKQPIKCFRLKGDGAADLEVGDTITVTGVIKNYQHSSGDCEIEFDYGCTFV